MREFVDVERVVAQKVEKAKSLLKEGKIDKVKTLLEEAIREDPYYLESYILLSEIYEMEGNIKEAEEVLESAYKKARELISVEEKLPDRLEWRHPTNRHIINAMINRGVFYWELGEIDRAIKVFKEVYRLNPTDEPGVRFYLLALLEGMSFDEFEQVFSRDEGYDYKDLAHWFEKHAPEHPDIFKVSR